VLGRRRFGQRVGLLAACLALAAGAPRGTARPTLAIERQDQWSTWWRADHAPERWAAAEPRVTRALAWRRLAGGVEWATARLAGSAPAWRTRLIVVRLDPRRVRFELALDLADPSGRPAWTIDRAPPGALVAVNAGQFVGSMPWGWVVMEGTQRLRPGVGPLSSALALDTSGTVRWIAGDSLRLPANGVRTAFQSYPTLLRDDGSVPNALRASGRGVDLGHRDGRLAIGQDRDGRVLLVMTRFAALGGLAEGLPVGPTTPEMAAVMGALGARDAVMLDGGISAQMVLREPASGRTWRWPGWRKVPMALITYPR